MSERLGLYYSLSEIIEAVVTNNIGYSPVKRGPFQKGSSVKLNTLDGRGISDLEYVNMHFHLDALGQASVMPIHSEEDRKMPGTLFTPIKDISF